MSREEFHTDHHFVPSVYLKHFANEKGKVSTYRTLVRHHAVPFWKETSPAAVGYHQHLYTRVAATQWADEFERWFDKEFESPASEALDRAVSDQRLNPEHWRRLVRFTAAQRVRTPAFFLRSLERWRRDVPILLNSVLSDSLNNLRAPEQEVEYREWREPHPLAEYLPVRITAEKHPDRIAHRLTAQAAAGRGLWQFAMRHILTNTLSNLIDYRWSIVRPHHGLTWFTSDDPVIQLNYKKDGSYDFGGGWGTHRTDILLPLGPGHLLYACVGEKPLRRGTTVDRQTTEQIRRFTAEHASRMVFAASQDVEILTLRPREENEDMYRREQERWQNFPAEQAEIEKQFRDREKY